jgi:hypothetical protein
MDDGRTNETRLTGPMRRVQARIGRDLEVELRERYQTQTMADIGAALGVSESTIHHWMIRLEIEARFPGQRARVA